MGDCPKIGDAPNMVTSIGKMTINHQIWSCPIFQTRFWLVSDSHSAFLVGFFSDQISALAGEQVLQPGRAMLLVATTWPRHESDVVQPDATNAIWLPADLVWREMIRYLEEFRGLVFQSTRGARVRSPPCSTQLVLTRDASFGFRRLVIQLRRGM